MKQNTKNCCICSKEHTNVLEHPNPNCSQRLGGKTGIDIFLKQWTSPKGSCQELVDHVKYAIDEAKREERNRILKELPKEKEFPEHSCPSLINNKVCKWNEEEGFNDCLKQIKDIIKK